MFPGLISLFCAALAMLLAQLFLRRDQHGVALLAVAVSGFLIIYAIALQVGIVDLGGAR